MLEKAICECYREKRKSKNGNEYEVLVITFDNGYKLNTFLNNEQSFILKDIPLSN